jgi:hypothetical protein
MKSLNAVNKILVFTIISGLISGCSLIGLNKGSNPVKTLLLYGSWHYTSVTKSGVKVFDVTNADSMVLEATGGFHYDIEAPNKHSRGIWHTKDSSGYKYLVLSYLPDLNNRYFRITHLSPDSLVFDEQGITFAYHR